MTARALRSVLLAAAGAAVLTACSEPNEQGFVHFGAHMWQRRSYAQRCKKTIAAVDPNMQFVFGDVWAPATRLSKGRAALAATAPINVRRFIHSLLFELMVCGTSRQLVEFKRSIRPKRDDILWQ